MSTVPYPSRPAAVPAFSSGSLLPEITFTLDDFVEDGAIAWLELNLVIGADTDRGELPLMIAELIRSTSQREIELGGMGLVLDREASSVDATGLTLVLRTLDVRRSQVRLEMLAGEMTATSSTATTPTLVMDSLTDLLDRTKMALQDTPPAGANGRGSPRFTRTTAIVRIRETTRRGQRL